MKKAFALVLALSLALSLAACASPASSQPASAGNSTASTPTASGEVTTIRFYGSDGEYNQNIVKGFEAANPDINVEIVPVDFDNAEQIIKTGIASGNPVDVSFFWGTQINAFTENDMALDLTSYLTENNNEWLNTFVPAYIQGGMVDEKYYAISYQPVVETIFYNKALFEEHGVAIPTTMDELMTACETFKAKGVYGIGDWSGQNHQMLQFAYQHMANDGTIEEYTSGAGDFTKCEGLKKCLTSIKTMYDKGYWYPGEGALTSTKDQTQAAWYQGKIAMLFDAGSNAGEYEKNCEFDLGVMPFPYVTKDGKYAVNVVTNSLFIPANAKNPEAAVRFMKYYTSDEGIQFIIDSGRLPATISMQEKVESPLLKTLLGTTVGDNVVGYKQMQGISSELNAYLQNDMVGAICTGTSIDDAMKDLETLRLAAQQE